MVLTAARDPLAQVLRMDASASGAAAWFGFTSGSAALMAAILAAAGVVAWIHDRRAVSADTVQEVEIAVEAPPPPPAVIEPEPAKPDEVRPQPSPVAAPPPSPPRDTPATPSAAPPAQAGQVLTAQSKPDEPVDLTNTFVQGIGDHYTRSFTTATGTGTTPPGDPPISASAAPAPRVASMAPPVQVEDRSRPPALSGAVEWSCPFPQEADSSQIDDAYVTLQVSVGPEGAATAAQVVSDPGHGFGREARRCAMVRRYVGGLDRDGNPSPGTTRPFRVHFSR